MNGPCSGAQSFEGEDAEYERRRDARIEGLRDYGAQELAEMVFDLEEEIGEKRSDGRCTGMHADVAEAVSAWEDVSAERDEYARLLAHAADLYEMFRRKYDEEGDRSERYRLAWLSARRRAARESEFAAEALALKDAEIARLTADLAENREARDSFAREIRQSVEKRMDERARYLAFADEVRQVRSWTMTGGSLMESHLRPIYDALHELEDADREGRPYLDHWTRVGPDRMADMCPACDITPESVPQPAPCLCSDEDAGRAYWTAELRRTADERA